MKLHAVVLSVENLLRADTREFSYLTDVFHVAPQPPHSSSVQLLMKYSLTFIWCKDCVVVVVVPLCSRRQQTNKQTNKQTHKQTDWQTDRRTGIWLPFMRTVPLWSPQVRSCCPTAIPIHTNYFKYRWRDREATNRQGKCDFRCISKINLKSEPRVCCIHLTRHCMLLFCNQWVCFRLETVIMMSVKCYITDISSKCYCMLCYIVLCCAELFCVVLCYVVFHFIVSCCLKSSYL